MKLIARLHGLYYLAAGIWPLAHMDSFLEITGAKTDLWLVRTVALLICVIGLTLLTWSRYAVLMPDTAVLACGAAVVLAGIDLFYVRSGVLPRVYLIDAPVESALALAWLGMWIRDK